MSRTPIRTAEAARAPHAEVSLSFVQAVVAAAIADIQEGRAADGRGRLRALPLADATPDMLSLVGKALLAADATSNALACFERALARQPANPDTLTWQARALGALGRRADAVRSYAAAAAAGSADPTGHYDHATLLREDGRLAEAIVAFDAALRLRPAYPEALRAGGLVLRDLGHLEAALRFLGEALRLDPYDRATLLDRTNLLQALGRHEEALADYDAALVLVPRQADLLNNRGIALQEIGRLPEARASFSAAVMIDPALAQGHLNLATSLVWFGEPAAALDSVDAALALKPDYAEAHCCRGVALKMLERLDEARLAYDAALALQPDFPHARANRGELRLLAGDLAAGWPDYAFRFASGRQDRPVLGRPVPEWDGTPRPAGTRIAVLADQGNGDIIQFARYLPLLVQQGFAVTFLCQARLQRMLRAVTAGADVTDLIPAEAAFDCQLPLSSVPAAMGTDLGTIPATPRYLKAETPLVRDWAERIGPHGLRIGLCWRGSQNWQADPRRSLPLEALASLTEVPRVRLFSLQMPDNTGGEEAAFEALRIDPLGAELDQGGDAFCDTAAAMTSLDLVVTCDTSIAHLAGALGRPVYVLLQAVPEWRWMLGRRDSPWYPSMRLFRQKTLGQWDAPIADLVAAVRTMQTRETGDAR